MWEGLNDFTQELSSSGTYVPCIKKIFGYDCIHCEKAAKLFDAGKENEGRKAYFKKQVWSYALVLNCESNAKFNKKVVLFNWPIRVSKYIIEKVSETDPDLRWSPSPTHLTNGGVVVLKKKKGEDYPSYSADYIQKPIDTSKFFNQRILRYDIRNPHELLTLLYLKKDFPLFVPANDMQTDSTVRLKILPNIDGQNKIPFVVTYVHYVSAVTPWDTEVMKNGFKTPSLQGEDFGEDSSDEDNFGFEDDDVPF